MIWSLIGSIGGILRPSHVQDATAQESRTAATAKTLMLSSIQLQDRVIAPALEKMGLWSRSAKSWFSELQ